MRTRMKDLAVILGTAALTALVATALLAPQETIAEDDRLMEMFVGAPGSLVVEDLTVTVDAGEKVQAPGAKPVLVLRVVSASKKTVSIGLDVELTSMRKPDMMSRSMPMPVAVFSKRIEAKVAPGETRTIQVETDFETKPDTIVGVNLIAGKKRVHAAGFGVKKLAPAAEPAVQKSKP